MPPQPPVALLTVANPKGDLVGLGTELEAIRASLESTGLEVQQRPYASLDGLLKALQDHRERMAVFHYGGHATELGLLLETGSNGALALAGGLAKVLSAQSSLRLLFLNGCSTEPQVAEFHRAGVPVVIGTRKPIPDISASRFAEWFYRSLSTGANIAQAFKEAQGAVVSTEGKTRDVVGVESNDNPAELWVLSAKDEASKEWSFAQALNDPLFGLPPLPERDLPTKPYKHLSYFSEEEAELFFGRSREIRDLYFRITTGGSAPVLLLYGQSGVGKSSLLDAGLTPRLRAGGYEVKYLRRDASLGLLGTLAKGLNTSLGGDLASAWKGLEARQGKPLVLLLDQLEEAYTRSKNQREADEELQALSKTLTELFASRDNRPKGKLVLSFRKEWVAETKEALRPNQAYCEDLPLLMPLNLEGINQAIVGPTLHPRLQHKYRLSIAEGLPTEIAQDLLDHDSPIAPTLQLTLTKMWDRASHNPALPPRFDGPLYREFERKGLGEFLDDQLKELGAVKPSESNSGLVLDLLHFHTTPQGTAEQHGEEALRQHYGSERFGQIEGLIGEAKREYLLTDPAGGNLKGTRLSHDTLAPYVRARFENSQLPGQRATRILENRKVDWRDGKEGTPLDERDLELVKQGEAGMRVLDGDEMRLLKASQLLRDQNLKTRVQQQQLNRRVRFGVPIAALVLAILGIGLGIQQRLTRSAQVESRDRLISKYQFGELIVPFQEPMLKALILQKLSEAKGNEPEAKDKFASFLKNSLLKEVRRFAVPEGMGEHKNAVGLAFNPEHPHLAAARRGAQVAVWNLEDGKQFPLVLEDASGKMLLGKEADRVAFSADGRVLAAGGWNGTVAVWEYSESTKGYQLLCASGGPDFDQPSEYVTAIALDNAGKQVVSGHSDGKIKRWSYQNGKCTPDMRAEVPEKISQPIASVKFSQDLQEVLAVSQQGVLWCHSPTSSKTIDLFSKGSNGNQVGQVLSAVFHPHKDIVLVGSTTGRFTAERKGVGCDWTENSDPLGTEVASNLVLGNNPATMAFVEQSLFHVRFNEQKYLVPVNEPYESFALQDMPVDSGVWVALGTRSGEVVLGTTVLDPIGDLSKALCTVIGADQLDEAAKKLKENNTLEKNPCK